MASVSLSSTHSLIASSYLFSGYVAFQRPSAISYLGKPKGLQNQIRLISHNQLYLIRLYMCVISILQQKLVDCLPSINANNALRGHGRRLRPPFRFS